MSEHPTPSPPAPPSLRLVGPRPRELFSDPTAGALWAALLTLDVGLQHEFLARLREKLAVPVLEGGTHQVRISRLVAAVREAEDMLLAQASGQPGFDPTRPPALTEDAYEGLRRTHPECGWPPASSARSWVQGGWNDVLRRAMVKTVDGGDALFVTCGGDYAWEEVAGAVSAFREHLLAKGHPDPTNFSLHDLLNWAKLPAVLTLAGRRPQSQGPFDKFGGFLAVKAAALAGEGPPDASAPRRNSVRSGHVRPTSGYGYTDAELKAAVAEVVAYRDGRVPRSGEFRMARSAILMAEKRAGRPARAFASYNKLLSRWKPWDAVLVACGYPSVRDIEVDPETGSAPIEGPRNHIPDEDLLAGIREAFEQRGKPFNHGVYRDYVKDRAKVALTGKRLGTYACIYSRLRETAGPRGPFKHACDLALPEGWDQPDE